jgi:hypothetical protein
MPVMAGIRRAATALDFMPIEAAGQKFGTRLDGVVIARAVTRSKTVSVSFIEDTDQASTHPKVRRLPAWLAEVMRRVPRSICADESAIAID